MTDHLDIDEDISIPLDAIDIQFVRSQGAGGQHVNKVASAVHLRFDFRACEALPDAVRRRISRLDDQRVTAGGIVIKAQQYRSQARNRRDALERLADVIRAATVEPKPRVPTRPSKSAEKRRVDDKRRAGRTKRLRGRVSDD
ncbi:MAG: alternative ribosome rescue aminoacyl-tRNA hydrolase ArfB [Woeseiaceae bacterium]|nr:alternative ribosome rescue aminoacyl-tRNA hydrolase ArfB [Woeseiaceae bacterium]